LNKYINIVITFAALLIISVLSFATNASALMSFHFHISNIGLGSDVKFKVTNTGTGQSLIYRTHILPVVSNTVSFSYPVTFPGGTSLKGCMTNFANRYESCDYTTVEARAADFFVSAIPP